MQGFAVVLCFVLQLGSVKPTTEAELLKAETDCKKETGVDEIHFHNALRENSAGQDMEDYSYCLSKKLGMILEGLKDDIMDECIQDEVTKKVPLQVSLCMAQKFAEMH